MSFVNSLDVVIVNIFRGLAFLKVDSLLHLHLGVLVKVFLKRDGLTEADLNSHGIDWISISKEVDCHEDQVGKVEPNVIDLS